MLIDSEWVDSSDHGRRAIEEPATGNPIDSVPEATPDDTKRALEAAKRAQPRMRGFPAHRRYAVLAAVATRIESEQENLAQLLARENGKPLVQTREELGAAARIFRGFAEESKRLFGQTTPLDSVAGMENHFALTIREPVGVVAAIVPFNYPAELYAHKAAAALAGGNAVIVKPPEDCPLTILKIGEMLEEAGLPQGAHQMLTGAGEVVGRVLSESPLVDLITITGSVEAGRDICRRAATTLKRVHLELGGNDPCIIFKDADLERAAEAVIAGRLARGNGQICCAVKRVFVHSSIMEDFARILGEKARKLKVGNPVEEDTDVGPLINETAAQKVESIIRDAMEQGGKIHSGGTRNGAFIEPTVLTAMSKESRVLTQETFGPVIPIVPFETIDEAIALSNDSDYGLQAAVFTTDIATAMEVSHRLEAGGVVVNWSSAVRVENLPFGGRKLSGHGRESIHDTILEMTEVKTIIMHDALAGFRSSLPVS